MQRIRALGQLIREHKLRSMLFFLGILILLFPIVSQVSYYLASHQKINQFEHQVSSLDRSDINRRIDLAQAYNSAISKHLLLEDPFTPQEKNGLQEYARMLEVNEQLGYLAIPTIGLDLPIYAGTSAKVLEKGSGHLEGSSLPVGGQSTHSVLTAHRGLPSARLFTDLNQLKKGDRFYVTNLKETLAYKVNQIKVIEPSQLDALTIVEGKDYVTLLTCTPYMINSHRLLVRGERISLPLKKINQKREARYQCISIIAGYFMW